MPVLVSIVMPSLSQVDYIDAAIASVLGQSWPGLELIVADGGSEDGTQSILERWRSKDRRLRWFSEQDEGPAHALNKAFSQCRGTLIGWLNADDLYTAGAVQRAVESFSAHPDWLMVYGHGQYIDAAGEVINSYPTRPPSTPITAFANGCFICQPTVFFKRTLPVVLGKLDERLQTAFDFDYWLRAFAACPGRIGFIDALQAQSRLHDNCITQQQRLAVALEAMQILARHLGKAPGHWLLTYMEEALSQGTDLPLLREQLADALPKAEEWLDPGEYRMLEQRIRRDIRLDAPPHQAEPSQANASCASARSGTGSADTEAKPGEALSSRGQPTQASDTTNTSVAGVVEVEELIRQHSLSEHLRFADRYFEGRDEHLYLYQKPFHHPTDSAASLANLGQLLDCAQLQHGMQVLDFAAGSCWLSKILVELGCKVISCDVSEKALAIGRRLFQRYPPIQAQHGEPEFLLFDGTTLQLDDASLDRIIVFDAFHHIPNPDAVLCELFRVLKPNGRVVMSEPGRYHSRTEASQLEMRQYSVIENDFVLEDIWEHARRAGFARIQITPILRGAGLDLQGYQSILAGKIPPKVRHALRNHTTNLSIFLLDKSAPEQPPPMPLEPIPEDAFDSDYYLFANPDVMAAIKDGRIESAWRHYVVHGRQEGRQARARS